MKPFPAAYFEICVSYYLKMKTCFKIIEEIMGISDVDGKAKALY